MVFSFNSGSGSLRLRSGRRFLDGEWHRVTALKERRSGVLRVDDVEEGRGEGPGDNFAADTEPPFYVGGIPPEAAHLAATVPRLAESLGFILESRTRKYSIRSGRKISHLTLPTSSIGCLVVGYGVRRRFGCHIPRRGLTQNFDASSHEFGYSVGPARNPLP